MIDTQLIALLARRLEVVRQIRCCKQSNELPLRDDVREVDVVQHCLQLASRLQVPDDIVLTLYEALFEHARGKG